MKTLKKRSLQLPFFDKLTALDHKWLVHAPWLWETRIHYVLVYALSLNFMTLVLLSITPAFTPFIVITFSLIGFGFWMYHLWQFSIEQDRGKTGKNIAQKRFGIYFISMFLFLLPSFLALEFQYQEWQGKLEHVSQLSFMLALNTLYAFIGAILIQVWKQIGIKMFIYTLVTNALMMACLGLMVNISAGFIVLIVALLIFGFPTLISLITEVPKIEKFSVWKVIALASMQFYSPFLLAFVMGVFMIPFVQLFSSFIFLLGILSALCIYIAYVLPTFRKMHIHIQSLPR